MEWSDIPEDLREKGYEIMKKEGTYLEFLRWKKRGTIPKMQKMFEDLFARHGQKLDGDPDSKVDLDGGKDGQG